jgi:hypothetical protein
MVLQRMTARARVQTAKFTDGSSRYSWCLLAPCAPQACTARIPASERLHPLPALVELDLSSFAFHLEMGDDDNAACAFLSTADHDGRGCQEMRSPQSTSMDSLFSQVSTTSCASSHSDAVASRTASHPTPFGFDHRLDPDYCFNSRGSSSSRSSILEGQTIAGLTPFDYGSNPFDYVGGRGPTRKPLQVATRTRTTSHPTPLNFDYRLDPDYCFDFRGPGSPRRSAFDGQTCAGATPFAY